MLSWFRVLVLAELACLGLAIADDTGGQWLVWSAALLFAVAAGCAHIHDRQRVP